MQGIKRERKKGIAIILTPLKAKKKKKSTVYYRFSNELPVKPTM